MVRISIHGMVDVGNDYEEMARWAILNDVLWSTTYYYVNHKNQGYHFHLQCPDKRTAAFAKLRWGGK